MLSTIYPTPLRLRTSVVRRVGKAKMKRSTASRGAFAILVALPLLPLCGIVLHGPPAMVFFMGAAAFICGVLLLVWLFAASSMPPDGSPPVARRFRFSIRDLLCLTTVVFGITMFMISGFRCEAAERASRPGPLPAVLYRQFAWELEAGLVCMTIGELDLDSSSPRTGGGTPQRAFPTRWRQGPAAFWGWVMGFANLGRRSIPGPLRGEEIGAGGFGGVRRDCAERGLELATRQCHPTPLTLFSGSRRR